MILEQKEGGNFTPHPPGIYPGVCVDVIELGLCRSEFQGQVKMVNKLKLVFETQCKLPDGQTATISKNFTATLHPKGKLTGFLGSWRGRAVSPAEKIDLDRLLGASCTLVISSQIGTSGRPYSSIDAVSKATVKLAPTGTYNGVLACQRIAEPAWLIDSSSPHRLWFCRVQGFDSRGTRRDGLLHESVEQLAAVPGKTPVETESELVEIRL